MKTITKEFLEAQDACASGMEWVTENKLIGLESNEFVQKLIESKKLDWANWLLVRLIDQRKQIQYAIFAAEKVLHNYETLYTDEDRPRKAIEAAKEYLNDSSEKNRFIASSAACAAYSAYSAADSAAYSARSSSRSAYSTYSSSRSAASAAYSAYSAARSARSADSAASTAYSAADSAARSAAYSAAYSAADSEAYSAARSAAYSAASADIMRTILNYGLTLYFIK